MNEQDKLIVKAVRSGHDTAPKILSWLERSGTPSSQQTLSRRLIGLIADQRIRQEGRGRATVYRYDDYLDYFAIPRTQRRAVHYNPDCIDRYIPNETAWFSPGDLDSMTQAAGDAEMDASTYSRAIAQNCSSISPMRRPALRAIHIAISTPKFSFSAAKSPKARKQTRP